VTALTIPNVEDERIIARDIRQQREQQRTAALLALSESTQSLDERTLLQQGLDQIQSLTGSRIGFLHFVSEDQQEIELITWSTDTLASYCHAAFDRHYPVSAAGIWADSIRLKQPVIVNDYATTPDKKGLPGGHSVLLRFISVPVVEGDRVRMIIGVGNSDVNYETQDVETVKLFAYDLYRIAQRRRAEQALRESEAEFRTLAEAMPQIVWVARTDGWNTYFSHQWMDYTGLTLEESLGHGWNKPFHPDDQQRALEAWQEATATGGVYSVESRLRRADGVYRWWLIRGTPHKDASGHILKWFGTCTDIHDMKVAGLDLAVSLKEKESLLREVHHRVKNNLQVISSLLRLESGRIEHPATTAVLKEMQGRIRAMSLLHEAIYRSDNFARVDMALYLKQLASQLLRSHTTGNMNVRLELDLSPLSLDIDQAVPCGLLLNELVSNALKHGFPAGRPGSVRVELKPRENGAFSLRVTDDGVGLPADFESKRGRSLGLQMVADLARQMKGRLAVDPGPAAVFEVTFTPTAHPSARCS